MHIYTTSQARQNFFKLVDETNTSHVPVYIVGKKHQSVLMSKEDYDAMVETLYLMSIPGMTESIIASRNEPIENFTTTLDWGDEETH
ncbi:MAG: type II toxin-antitoxin system Phd/YefM family antitoxin [Alphaproteobacteria bacterium]|nr:type II toxin-antitoxin system Phd/YefM family antitoxin [Alphaproteobacteria bacterium]